MAIREIKASKREYLQLVIYEQEQQGLIDQFIDRGTMYIVDEDGPKAECIVTDEGDGVLEIKHLSTYYEYQHGGCGRELIEFLCDKYKDDFHLIKVCVADCQSIVPFYEKCGFKRTKVLKDYFLKNFDHPIFDDTTKLVDMVYLEKEI